MLLKKLRLDKYRNISKIFIEPSNNLTIIYGKNGQGKTNLIESIFMLANARPFRFSKISDHICHGFKTATICGTVQNEGIENEIFIQLENSARRVSINGKNIQNALELHGKLVVVLFSPDDVVMVKFGPEIRRRYFDRSLYTAERNFLHNYQNYYHTLKQRNALLKTNNYETLDIWTEQLADAGNLIMEERQRYIIKLQKLFQKNYQRISGQHEKVEIKYKPDVTINLKNALLKQLEQDKLHKNTGLGPHRDDILFFIDGKPLKVYGSQGQQRSFVLALKMAEMNYINETFGEQPLLLLDDIASELDKERMMNLLTFIHQQKLQTLVTTTDINNFLPILQNDSRLLQVEGGRLIKEETITK